MALFCKKFKKIFQRHKKSLESRNQAEKYRPYTAPKTIGIWERECREQQISFICIMGILALKYNESKDVIFNIVSGSENCQSSDHLPA